MSLNVVIDSRLGNEMPVGTYTMTLRDKNGNITKQGTYPIHSAIHQYWQFLWNTVRSQSSAVYQRVNGGTFTLQHLNARAGGADGAMGIVVGTSNDAVNIGQTTLGGYIRNGTVAGELSYETVVVGYDADTGIATLTRQFTNNNATVDPTVNEVGVCLGTSTTQEIDGLVIIRDVPGSSYVVLFESTLTVSYQIQLPFGCKNHGALFMRHQIARNTTTIELFDSNGTSVNSSSFATGTGAFGFVANLEDDTRGIIVGNGNAVEEFNTFALDSKIVNGTNLGELHYFESTISGFEWSNTVSDTARFYLSRPFRNRSGGAVTIREVGLSSNFTIGATNNTYLFDRRVLASPISVSDGEIITITWAYKYDFT
jgi:hypothetical protein